MKIRDYISQEHVKNEIRSRFNYNKNTGELTWAFRDESIKRNVYFNKTFKGKVVGSLRTDKTGYTAVMVPLEVFGKRFSLIAARVCWLVETGDWPKNTIDHINGDSTDNRWSNLRDVTQGVNNANKRVYKRNSVGFKGVNKHHGKYWARVSYNKTTHTLGHYNTPEEAAHAYDNKALELWGDKAVLNFPVDKE